MVITLVEFVRIPEKRIGVLIGKNGEIKKQIERLTKTRIEIEGNEVTIFETEKMEDPLGVWTARDIVKAIGRGFSPENALSLMEAGHILESVDLKEYCKTPASYKRIKGRIIGRNGSCRRRIEELTNTSISIYGKTVCIIGNVENVRYAKEAIDRLGRGASHTNVYKYLERMMASLRW